LIELPLGLRRIIESGEGILFIGSGIGEHLRNEEGKKAPDGMTLSRELCQIFSIDAGEEYDLAKISQIVVLRKGRAELEAYLRGRLVGLEPDKYLRWLFSLRWRAIYTTNYDNGIQRTYDSISQPKQHPVTISTTSEMVAYDIRFDVPIFHLHGTLFGSGKPYIVITEDDYSRFKEQRQMLFEKLKIDYATAPILYVGYSNRDPNWKMLLSEIAEEFFPSKMPQSFRIAPETNALDREILKSRNIETIDCSLQEFVEAASVVESDLAQDFDKLRAMKAKVPQDLLDAFESNPVAVTRLLSSWDYVNQAPFNETPNVKTFLRGDRPNWGLIGSRAHFERDIEEDIYDSLLDFATSSRRVPKVDIVLGPAGYGVTTLLMTLAARLVQEKAGPVFMLKPARDIREGDVEFAVSISDSHPFFFVDNAAEYSTVIHTITHILKETGKSAMFILGERLNEWRQAHVKLRTKEFLLEPLSDPEIHRLLECLEKHDELNKLKDLKSDLQFAAIKVNYKKELLVAMREATEGQSFNAILEDEYRGIGDTTSRQLYLVVCCFYQHGAYVRDRLLEQLLGMSLPELYEKTGNATEGVVIYDCIDESSGIYGARARHRTIAAIVWERCSGSSEKEMILNSALNALNLAYKVDRDAFEDFYRSDRIVDSIHSLDGKIRFFDSACRKDPLNPYVRQHYARMLSREDKAELALGQINEALGIDSKILILHHTRGVILMQLALSIESPSIARRRLVQSEESFRRGLSMYPRDEYCYQGLAQLYLGWAKRAETEDEVTDYVAKAEEVVTEGLTKARVRDGLWIESSNIQKFLGDDPARVSALERAVRESPGSIIARYLLGRAFRKSGDYGKALEVLEPTIRNHPDEFRSFVEYAVSLLHVGRPYAEGIAILRQSTLYGFRDPRFIATLGGMLFMNKEYTGAREVFNESSKRDFTAVELNAIEFRPPNREALKEPLRIKGRVIIVKAGYVLIDAGADKPILCPGSKYEGAILRKGLEVSFELVFTAKGAIAVRPMPI
jgi:tetratricopeptide (TPR) repeat protein